MCRVFMIIISCRHIAKIFLFDTLEGRRSIMKGALV